MVKAFVTGHYICHTTNILSCKFYIVHWIRASLSYLFQNFFCGVYSSTWPVICQYYFEINFKLFFFVFILYKLSEYSKLLSIFTQLLFIVFISHIQYTYFRYLSSFHPTSLSKMHMFLHSPGQYMLPS